MLISTHLADDVSALCERVLILDRGALVFDGTPNELVEHGPQGSDLGSPSNAATPQFWLNTVLVKD